ncbi:aminoglycoside phosphotransferase family protein [Kribbella sp. NPDC058693]|uniref:aminoglycoside phosphotransferase family protein n=1 Tax=Kribbella sp. NPDC058693 TaxID=3346602 RepID=UPI00365BA796
MAGAPFSRDAISAALGVPLSDVRVLDTFAASAAEVARVGVRTSDGSATVIAKHATGDGLAAARREIRFYEQLAPRWNHPAPRLLGATDDGDSILLLTEDLDASGYHVVGTDVSEAQLHGAIDVLAAFHREFWDDVPTVELEPSVTSTAQAWPPEVITRSAAAVRAEAKLFFDAAPELGDRSTLVEIVDGWESQFLRRVGDGRALTLIHGDFHFLGNVFFTGADPRPKVIDWSELKPGLGPHDLAYSLAVIPAADRLALLRRYWEALAIDDYSRDLCEWDFRFSVISNLFQSIFQHSTHWYRVSLAAIDSVNARSTLTTHSFDQL